MQNFNLNDLDLQNPGAWPKGIKLFAYVLIFILTIVGGYQFFIKEKNQQLKKSQTQTKQLEAVLEKKVIQAANLPVYRAQLATIEANFAEILRQLPKDTEIPGLLDDISHAGVGSGLDFKSITLQPEQAADFYNEIPMELIVEGNYHELGSFVSAIASLPRVVTLHDFTLEPAKNSNHLKLTILAKTYRYDEGSQDEDKQQIPN